MFFCEFCPKTPIDPGIPKNSEIGFDKTSNNLIKTKPGCASYGYMHYTAIRSQGEQ